MESDLAVWECEIEIALLPPNMSVRKTPISSGYRPNHKHPVTGEYFMGQLELDQPLNPGGTGLGSVRALVPASDLGALQAAGTWTIWEGPHRIGSVRVVS